MAYRSAMLAGCALVLSACPGRPVPVIGEIPDTERPGYVWREIPSHTDAILYHVWGSGPSDVFVGGNLGLILHCDGMRCSRMPLPAQAWAMKVGGTAADDVWAIGSVSVFRYDGHAWRQIPVGLTVHRIGSMWAFGPSNVLFSIQQGKMLRFDGKSFSKEQSPVNHLMQIWASSKTDVFAVGGYGNVIHYDGDSWKKMDSGTTAHLKSVWGSGPNNVYAVGDSGVIIHYNGSRWQPQQSGVTEKLLAVWGSGPKDIYAAGRPDALLRFDGTRWRKVLVGWKETLGVPSTASISGLWGSGPDCIYAVGPPGVVLRYMPADSATGAGDP